MKINIISILASLVSAALLAGCAKTAPERIWASDPDAVHIEASVWALTKAYPFGNAEEQKQFKGPDANRKFLGDEIAVSMVDNSGQVEKTVTYRFDAEVWNPVPATDYLVWKAPVTYKAWYPASSKDGFTLPTDQSESLEENYGNSAKADFMTGEYICASRGEIPTDHKLMLVMQRKMALVTVNVDKNRLNNQFDGKDIYKINVESIQSGYSTVSSDGNGSGNPVNVKPGPTNIAYDNNVGKGVYHAIVVPCKGDASAQFLKVSVWWKPGTTKDGTELYVTGRPTFEAGKHYTYNLTIGKDKVEAGDITVSDWGAEVNLNGDQGEFDADKAPDPVSVSDLRKQLEEWNAANPENKKELKDLITKELLDECCVGGKLILTGEFDNTTSSLGMSEETIKAFAQIAAYVRDNDVTYLDMSGLKGVTSLMEVTPYGAEEVYNLRFSSVIENTSTVSGKGSKLETFIGSDDVANINYAFAGCADLVSVSGLKNVKNADYAFMSCSKLSKTPDLPNVVSLKSAFNNTPITELKYKSAQKIYVYKCPELKIIDCPNVVSLEDNAFVSLSKLTEIRLESKYFESVHFRAFNGISSKGQTILYLDESQKDNIDVANKKWTPIKSNGESAVCGEEQHVYIDYFKVVYCGKEQIIPKI